MSDLETINAKIDAWTDSIRAMTDEQIATALKAAQEIAGEALRVAKQITRFYQLWNEEYRQEHDRRYHAYLRKRRRGQAWAKTTPYRFRLGGK